MFKKLLLSVTVILVMSTVLGTGRAFAGVTLFTPYTGISLTPGETVSHTVDVINEESRIQHVTFEMDGLPEDWDYSITADGNPVRQLSVRENSEQEITLEITAPLEIEQADYTFSLNATDQDGSSTELPVLAEITEEGTLATELNVDQSNLQGDTSSTFSYSATIRNRTAEEQNYALNADIMDGWTVQFQSGGDNVTSVAVEPNSETTINIDVTSPENAPAETYEIPISAAGSGTSAEAVLEAVITGSYGLEVTTPSGNVSTDITAGSDKNIELIVNNTGSVPVTNVEVSASTPENWEASFEPASIPEIAPGESASVQATLTASDEAIAGDYITTFSASAEETSAETDFRVSVETSTLWGIIGIVIILAVIGGLYFLIRKYGRR